MSASNPIQAPGRFTILIVDDMPENLAVLGDLLQSDYRVRAASSGARALAAAVSEPRPDLILLDVMMPEMDGYEVLERLRAMPETRDIPVIFVTAMDAAEDEARGLDLGAVDYIAKPLRPSIVRARVHTHLELKQARDRMRDQNAWLEGEVEHRLQEIRLIQDISLRALANLAETRDNETGNHILRTQGYVELLCQELSDNLKHRSLLTPDNIRVISKAAQLHDIGKVGIPDHILLKPGKLNEDEWLVMRTHTTLGAEAIRQAFHSEQEQPVFGFLRTAVEIAQSHHERWDGSGYPHGLKGEAIPLPARIMALADVFDALISKRVYKAAFSLEQSLGIIDEGRGTHFDPDVVDAFFARADEFRAIALRLQDPGNT